MPNESKAKRENGLHSTPLPSSLPLPSPSSLPLESLADYWARRDAELLADVTLIEVLQILEIIEAGAVILEVWF